MGIKFFSLNIANAYTVTWLQIGQKHISSHPNAFPVPVHSSVAESVLIFVLWAF